MLKVKLLAYTPEPEKVIAIAARICYSNKADIETIADGFTEEEVSKFIEQLILSGHHTPLEHSSFTFGIEGISRTVSHELVRHRIGIAVSQRSQRYCSEDETEFICPDIIAASNEQVDEIFWSSVANSLGDYKDLLREEIPKEAARYVLPNATATRMIVTMNARELRHFFALRCCRRALPEMQNLATLMLSEVKKVAPNLFKTAGPSCVQLGYCPEGKRSCGLKPTLEKLKEGYRLAKILERNDNGQ